MNKCIFYGIVATDLNLRTKKNYDETEFKSLYFILAVKDNKNYKYIPCVAYNKVAELIAEYVKKDDKLIVSGSLELFEKNQGAEIVQTFNIKVREVNFVDNRIKGATVVDEDDQYIMMEKEQLKPEEEPYNPVDENGYVKEEEYKKWEEEGFIYEDGEESLADDEIPF